MNKILIIFAIFLVSCVEPIELSEDRSVNVLVVEGGISTGTGPHFVRLTRSARYGSVFAGTIGYETGASVFVRDDLGRISKLSELGQGIYSTPEDFIAEVDRTYILLIESNDGILYQSIPQQLTAVPEIDSILYQFKTIDTREGSTRQGVEVIVQYLDPSDKKNFYKWETKGTYRIKTRPDLYTPPRSQTPVPKDCCDICYKDEINSVISISSDRLYNGNRNQKTIIFVEDDGMRFSDKYVIEISQKSISLDAYQYYDLLLNQLRISGNIFDPPPATIRGNMINITNPDEDVVGFFTVSDVKTSRFEIFGFDLPSVLPIPLVPDDCREVDGASTIVPEFW